MIREHIAVAMWPHEDDETHERRSACLSRLHVEPSGFDATPLSRRTAGVKQSSLVSNAGSNFEDAALGRTIAYLFVICTVLLVLAVLVSRRGDIVPGMPETDVPQGEPAIEDSVAAQPPSQPTTANRTGELQTPPRSEPNILAAITRQPFPDIVSPPWADEMEGAILNHVAQRPGLELTELQVQCAEEQCVIFLGGDRIPIYEMGFDVFASEHGFDSAVIQSMDGGPNRFVYLRR